MENVPSSKYRITPLVSGRLLFVVFTNFTVRFKVREIEHTKEVCPTNGTHWKKKFSGHQKNFFLRSPIKSYWIEIEFLVILKGRPHLFRTPFTIFFFPNFYKDLLCQRCRRTVTVGPPSILYLQWITCIRLNQYQQVQR